MQEEDDVDDGDDDRLFDQRPLECRDGPLDERRSVVERHNPDPRRQAGLQRGDLSLHAVDHIDGADAVAGHDHAADGLVRSLDQRRGSEGIANLHLGHLLDEDRHAALGADDDVLDVTDIFDETEAAHDRPAAARLDDVAADVSVAPRDGVDDGRERDLVGAQACGIDVDLVLPHRAPDAGDFGDAGHRVELVADEPILERSQISQRVALAFDGVPEHVTDAGRIGPERRDDTGRQRLGQQIQPLQHPRPCEVEIDRVFEDDVDHREPEGGRRAHDAHAGQALQAHGQRIRDLVFHLLRRASRPISKDDDLVVAEVRNRVDRRGQQRPVAPDSQEREQAENQETVPKRHLDQPVDHEPPSSPDTQTTALGDPLQRSQRTDRLRATQRERRLWEEARARRQLGSDGRAAVPKPYRRHSR